MRGENENRRVESCQLSRRDAVRALTGGALALAEEQPQADRFEYVPEQRLRVEDTFWRPMLERTRTITVPHNLKMCREVGILANFKRTAGIQDGSYEGLALWDETLYKTIEAAARCLGHRHDAALEREVDEIIGIVARAQEPDGYLRTFVQLSERGRGLPGIRRWDVGRHLELYCAGHLYEAAAAHFQATGKRTLLEVALKNAQLVERLFGPGKRVDVCEHPEVELALASLGRATGERRWYELAKFFVDTRGTAAGGRKMRGPFSQDHAPLFEQTEAVGQAPRATYFYSGASDVGRWARDPRYHAALKRLWDEVVRHKLYINGGIGARHENEGFGEPYELPNRTAYSEICAAVSFPMWAARMFANEQDAGYIDVLERTIYNNLAAGVSLTGDRYFYACPLESDGRFAFNRGWLPKTHLHLPHAQASATRKEWFPCACCPPNLARFLPQITGLAYARRGAALMINLYIAGEAEIELATAHLSIRLETAYPWDGKIRVVLRDVQGLAGSQQSARFTLMLRVPGWARGAPVPGDLYRFAERMQDAVRLVVRGSGRRLPDADGYACVEGEWRAGDSVELTLPMHPRLVRAHPAVTDCEGKAAIQRGPLVYCFEEADQQGPVLGLVMPPRPQFRPVPMDQSWGGMLALEGRLLRAGRAVRARAIPYCLWSNRGAGEMAVWLPVATP